MFLIYVNVYRSDLSILLEAETDSGESLTNEFEDSLTTARCDSANKPVMEIRRRYNQTSYY